MSGTLPGPRVLVVDDEPAIREALSFALTRDGCSISLAGSIRDARAACAEVDLIVLDLVLPDGAGLNFLRELRQTSDVPVIVLTSRDEEKDRVLGLTLGADDYVVKPFSPREVAARVRAVLRRIRPAAESSDAEAKELSDEPLLGPRSLRVEPRTRRASLGKTLLVLSRTEFNLLAALLRSPGKVFERQDLLAEVWGQDVVVGERTVDVHIKALRRKLDDASEASELIETVRGVGYRMREE